MVVVWGFRVLDGRRVLDGFRILGFRTWRVLERLNASHRQEFEHAKGYAGVVGKYRGCEQVDPNLFHSD